MTLIFRAVWNDQRPAPATLTAAFNEWCASKGFPDGSIPRRGRFVDSANHRWLEVRRADAEIGEAVRCTLHEELADGRTWTTTSTAMSTDGRETFWIDVECESPDQRPIELAAPRLVRLLLDGTGDPRREGALLSSSAAVLGPNHVETLVAQLRDPSRSVPIVVFSADERFPPAETIKRANAAAKTLAGLAQIYALSPEAEKAMERLVPQGFHVYGGAVRLYNSQVNFDDPADAYRHRWIARRVIDTHPRRAASILARRIAQFDTHPPVPTAWDELGGLLRRPSEEQIEERKASVSARTSRNAGEDSEGLNRRIDELMTLLAVAELQLDEHSARIRHLESELETKMGDHIDDVVELELARDEADRLRSTLRALWRGSASISLGPNTESLPLDPEDLPTPLNITEAVLLAQESMSHLVIPNSALQDLENLEQTAKDRIWAAAIWQGLMTLNAYSRAKANKEETAGIYQWCDQTGDWSLAKLAMTESETLKKNRDLWNKRLFEVDPIVSPNGRIHMESHLKIQAGGGLNIPRVYFLDETDRATGAVHIGFIGPHYLVPNSLK